MFGQGIEFENSIFKQIRLGFQPSHCLTVLKCKNGMRAHLHKFSMKETKGEISSFFFSSLIYEPIFSFSLGLSGAEKSERPLTS